MIERENLERAIEQMLQNVRILRRAIQVPDGLPERERDPEGHLRHLELDIDQIRSILAKGRKEER